MYSYLHSRDCTGLIRIQMETKWDGDIMGHPRWCLRSKPLELEPLEFVVRYVELVNGD